VNITDRISTNYSSNLSQEFYQVMAGDPRMTVHGWKQLAQWSIEHSCLTPAQIKEAQDIHARAWAEFCDWVVDEHGRHADTLKDPDMS
jgi:adenosine deaminase CECR1